MTAQDQDITGYFAGDSLTIQITVTDSSGNALDLSGASIEWVLTETHDRTRLIEKTTENGGISITDAANGVFEIYVQPQDTADLTGDFDHEAEVTDAGGNVVTVTSGIISIEPSEV